MNKGKLTVLRGASGGRMKNHINDAKRKAEDELARKIEKSKGYNVDVRDIFTDADFDVICQNNEFFNGKIVDISKVQRYEKLKKAAQWLEAKSIEVVGIEIEPIEKDHPNAIIAIDIRRVSSFRDKELKAFSAMYILADTVFVSGVKDSVVRFTFGIEDIWEM